MAFVMVICDGRGGSVAGSGGALVQSGGSQGRTGLQGAPPSLWAPVKGAGCCWRPSKTSTTSRPAASTVLTLEVAQGLFCFWSGSSQFAVFFHYLFASSFWFLK
eukprot:EG_transcript_56439